MKMEAVCSSETSVYFTELHGFVTQKLFKRKARLRNPENG
jgi:hypothetical protein